MKISRIVLNTCVTTSLVVLVLRWVIFLDNQRRYASFLGSDNDICL